MKMTARDGLFWKTGVFAALAGLAVLGACASETASAQNESVGEGEAAESAVLARIGEVEILRSDVEATVANELRDLDREFGELVL